MGFLSVVYRKPVDRVPGITELIAQGLILLYIRPTTKGKKEPQNYLDDNRLFSRAIYYATNNQNNHQRGSRRRERLTHYKDVYQSVEWVI